MTRKPERVFEEAGVTGASIIRFEQFADTARIKAAAAGGASPA